MKLLRAALLATAAPTLAHAQTTIVPDGANSPFSTGTTVTQSGRTTTIDGGVRAGDNLFHSFTTFNIGNGDTARWTAPDAASIRAVVNRVTGGAPSTIDGRIDSTALPNAAFYFINPAGIVFADGASINVPGAAHFATAQELRFADGARFSAVTPTGSTFTVAAPTAFGFLGGQGDIAVRDGTRTLAAPDLLELAAANVRIGDRTLTASGMKLAAVGSGTGTLAIGDPLPTGLTGTIRLTGSTLQVSAAGRANVADLSAGTITATDATIRTITTLSERAADLRFIADRMSFTNSTILTRTGGAGPSGALIFLGGTLTLDGTDARARSDMGATGNVGDVSVTLDRLTMTNDAILAASSFSAGRAGRVTISAGTVNLSSGATIASASNGAGDSGVVAIAATSLVMADAGTKLDGSSYADGNAGGVLVQADSVRMTDGAIIQSLSQSRGNGGLVQIEAGSLTLIGTGLPDGATVNTAISASANSVGNAGNVLVDANSIHLSNGATIRSLSQQRGSGGLVTVTADSLVIDTDARINTSSYGPGHAGRVAVTAGTTSLDKGSIFSEANGPGDAGNITLVADELSLANRSVISSRSDSSANAGDVVLTLGSFSAADGSIVSTSARQGYAGRAGAVTVMADMIDFSGGSNIVSEAYGQGNSGIIAISATRSIFLDSGAFFSTSSFSGAPGGALNVQAPLLSLINDAFIASDALGSGPAGRLSITADFIALQLGAGFRADSRGAGAGGDISVTADSLNIVDAGFISTDTYGSGMGGHVGIHVNSLLVGSEDGANYTPGYISSDSVGTGQAGGVNITAHSVELTGGLLSSRAYAEGNGGTVEVHTDMLTADNGTISADDYGGGGAAGNVIIGADSIALSGYAAISSTVQSDKMAGNVMIDAGTISLADFSTIEVSTEGTGSAGTVSAVVRGLLAITGNAGIRSDTIGRGAAGSVSIAANAIALSQNGQISSASGGAGPAGSVTLHVTDALTLRGAAQITSSASPNAGNAGSIAIDAASLFMTSGTIASRASAGSGNAGSIAIRTPSLTVTDGGLITANLLSAGLPGSVTIDAGTLLLDNGFIRSNLGTLAPAASTSDLSVRADSLTLRNGGAITATSGGPNGIGNIRIMAGTILMTDAGTAISTANSYQSTPGIVGGEAGMIALTASAIRIREGAQVTSNSLTGPAGAIQFLLPSDGLLRLDGDTRPGIITTSSGPGTGGRISIRSPRAVISNGGTILAQGQSGGAFLSIDARYLINSADRLNIIRVDGAIAIQSNLYDVSTGLSQPDIAFLDSANVLSGQCAATRASGITSQLSARAYGPYVPGRAGRPLSFSVGGVPAC